MVETGLARRLHLIWAFRNEAGSTGNFVRRKAFSSAYLYHLLTAKYIIGTHGVPYWKSRKQISILLWHGFPTKIENLDTMARKLTIHTLPSRINHLIATSSFGAVVFSSKFRLPLDKILLLGEPRCDGLFKSRHEARRTLEEVLGERIASARIIFYLPTFRDYDTLGTHRVAADLLRQERFGQFIKKWDSLLILKPHIYDEGIFEDYGSNYDSMRGRFRIITSRELHRHDVTLYDFMAAADILVTDYSSVSRDYLLVDRPIVFYVPDLEEYRKKRNFILEPFELWSPGDKAKNSDELINALEDGFKNPKKWERERAWLRDVMFAHRDGNSSERIINHFWGGAGDQP